MLEAAGRIKVFSPATLHADQAQKGRRQ